MSNMKKANKIKCDEIIKNLQKRGMQGYPESSVIDAGLRPGGTLKVFLNGRVWDAGPGCQ